MKAEIDNNVYFAQTTDLGTHTRNVSAIDIHINFKTMSKKLEKVSNLFKNGIMDEDVIKYILALDEAAFPEMIYYIKTNKHSADQTSKT